MLVLGLSAPLAAAERYALIISGANGEASYAEQYGQWRQATVTAPETEQKAAHRATRYPGVSSSRL